MDELLNFLTERPDVERWVRDHLEVDGPMTVHGDGTVSVEGSVRIKKTFKRLGRLMVKFRSVTGSFDVGGTLGEDLAGTPDAVGESLLCSDMPNLRSLADGPLEVGDFVVANRCPRLDSYGMRARPEDVRVLTDSPRLRRAVTDYRTAMKETVETLRGL